MRAADFVEDPALERGPREAAEFADELPDRPALAEVPIAGDMGGEIALEPLHVVPVSTGRVARSPLFPMGVGRRHVDERAAVPRAADRQMRVEPDIGRNEALETALGLCQPPRRR